MPIEKPADLANKAVSDAYANAGGGQDRGYEHVSRMITDQMTASYQQFKKGDPSASDQLQYLSTANKDLQNLGFPVLQISNTPAPVDVPGIGMAAPKTATVGLTGGPSSGVLDGSSQRTDEQMPSPHVGGIHAVRWE
jgi:hypothetical protein